MKKKQKKFHEFRNEILKSKKNPLTFATQESAFKDQNN